MKNIWKYMKIVEKYVEYENIWEIFKIYPEFKTNLLIRKPKKQNNLLQE